MNNDMDLTSDVYPRFQTLKLVTKVAGILGVVSITTCVSFSVWIRRFLNEIVSVVQSVIWIALSILGMLSYFCVLAPFGDDTYVKSATGWTFYELYFGGSCADTKHSQLTIDNIRDKSRLSPSDVNIIVWIYLILSVFWLGISSSIITKIDEKHLRRTNILLYGWIFNTLVICALDLATGILFGLEYNAFAEQLENITPQGANALLFSMASVVAISIVIIALKGFILWIINVCLAIYFFMETFVINEFATSRVSLVTQDIISDTNSIITKSPISAYDTRNPYPEHSPVRINTDALERANKMIIRGLKERVSNKHNPQRFREYSGQWELNLPVPDYTPPMPRKHKFYNEDRTLF